MENIHRIMSKAEATALAKQLDTDEYIRRLENFTNIWDHRKQDHHRKAREEWGALAIELKTPIQVCKAKYSSLRTYFVKEFRKVNTEGISGQAANTYTTQWPFYDSLMFLAPTITITTHTSGSIIPPTSNADSDEEESDAHATSSSTPAITPVSKTTSTPTTTASTTTPQTTKRKSSSDNDNSIKLISSSLSDLVQSRKDRKSTPVQDECYYFAMSVTNQLRNLSSPHPRALAMLKIQEVFVNFTMPTPSHHMLAPPQHLPAPSQHMPVPSHTNYLNHHQSTQHHYSSSLQSPQSSLQPPNHTRPYPVSNDSPSDSFFTHQSPFDITNLE